MSRTDDDSWDITEGVGATALTVARARVLESEADCPLYTDPYAHFFIEAATDAGWRLPWISGTCVYELERRRTRMAQARRAAAEAGHDELPDTAALWYFEPRANVAQWLTDRGWEVETIDAAVLMDHYQRPPADAEVVPDTTFVDATKD